MLKLTRTITTWSTMKLDPAVLKVLDLNSDKTRVASAGGGGCSSASTSKIISQLEDGTEKAYFLKTGSDKEAELMFQGTYTNIQSLHYIKVYRIDKLTVS